MIEWIKYEPTSRAIESHVTHLVINEAGPHVAQHAKSLKSAGYKWYGIGGYVINGVTHWAKINLPTAEGQPPPIDYKKRYEALVQGIKDGLGEYPPAKSAEDLACWIESTCPFVGDLREDYDDTEGV